MDSVSGTPIWKDWKRSMSQVYPNVSLQYVSLRRPITSSFHKCITVEFLIVMNKCPNISSAKIDSTSGRNRCSKPQKHQLAPVAPQFQLKFGWSWIKGGFYFISEFFCGWERETWAPTGNSWRAPETSAFRFATWIPIMLPSFSSKIWQRTQGATLQNGWSAAHSLPCWQDVTVCCLSADGNERQAANLYGVPQRHPFIMMTSMKA